MADVPAEYWIWTAKQCAEHLRIPHSRFVQVTQYQPGFPARLPAFKGHPRWRAMEVMAWKPTPKARKQTCLYWHWDAAGRLLYVGISLTAMRRMARHGLDSRWFDQVRSITIDRFSDRRAALEAEKRAIKTFAPKFNIKHRG